MSHSQVPNNLSHPGLAYTDVVAQVPALAYLVEVWD